VYLRSTIANRVAEVVLDHPPVNALDSAGWEHLAATITALGADASVSVVVIAAAASAPASTSRSSPATRASSPR